MGISQMSQILGCESGQNFSLVRILVGSWERWETVLGFLGVWTILCAV